MVAVTSTADADANDLLVWCQTATTAELNIN